MTVHTRESVLNVRIGRARQVAEALARIYADDDAAQADWCDPDEMNVLLNDALADLLHLFPDLDLEERVERARDHYLAEINEEYDDDAPESAKEKT